jgi:hypothetical protein
LSMVASRSRTQTHQAQAEVRGEIDGSVGVDMRRAAARGRETKARGRV